MGMLAANVATWTYRVGQAWLVLELTGDGMLLGLVTALQFLPMLLIGPWAGVLAERSDRRRLLMRTQSALALQAAALAVVTLAGAATPATLVVVAAALGLITALDGPARAATVSDLVPPDRIVNAVSLNSASLNSARLVGPAVAGLLIAAAGTGWVFLVSAFGFLLMVVGLSRIRTRQAPSGARAAGGVMGGVRHVRSHPDLLYVMVLTGVVSMLALNYQLTVALMSTETFGSGPAVFGILGSVMAVGSLAGSLLSARRGDTGLRLITFAAISLAATTTAAGLAPNVWSFAAVLILCGISALTMMTAANSYLQTRSGPDHRSRVLGLYLAVFFGTTPIGAPIVGWLSEAAGPRMGLVVPGLAALAAALTLPLVFRRRLQASRVSAPDR